MGAGALTLICLGGVVVTARDFYLDRSGTQVVLFFVAVVVAIVWAFFRVVQYSA